MRLNIVGFLSLLLLRMHYEATLIFSADAFVDTTKRPMGGCDFLWQKQKWQKIPNKVLNLSKGKFIQKTVVKFLGKLAGLFEYVLCLQVFLNFLKPVTELYVLARGFEIFLLSYDFVVLYDRLAQKFHSSPLKQIKYQNQSHTITPSNT